MSCPYVFNRCEGHINCSIQLGTTMKYIRITRACIGIERNKYDTPVSKFTFYEGELFEVHRVYNYYDKDNEHWNTEHPVATIRFDDDDEFIIYYNIPPDCYVYVEDECEGVTTFIELDLVEREELLSFGKSNISNTVNNIVKIYLAHSRSRFKVYLWQNI